MTNFLHFFMVFILLDYENKEVCLLIKSWLTFKESAGYVMNVDGVWFCHSVGTHILFSTSHSSLVNYFGHANI